MSNYYQKSNYIEYKTLEYYFNGDQEKAKRVYDIRHKLTSKGFEIYINFYMKRLGFDMSYLTGGYKDDGGIDLKCEKEDKSVYVQCKKYFRNHKYKGKVSVKEVRDFFGGIVDRQKGNILDKNIYSLFITTGDYSSYAIEFAKRNNIELLNYTDIADISEVYNLEDFEKDIALKGYSRKYLFNPIQVELFQLSFDDLEPDDIFKYLVNIRDRIASITLVGEKNTGFIFEDETLRKMSKQRVHNYEGLKRFIGGCENEKESSHILMYGNMLLNGLKSL